ncbi:MAG: response regulator [Gammaproteobacteria bacterium]|nr:MAG: response regulator [Gammaproteobacteria bacterium]
MAKPLKTPSVLVTDDNPDNRVMAIECFRALLPHAYPDEAGNGEIALNLVREKIRLTGKSYDLIMMDYQMPGLNGQETTLKIREMEASLKEEEKSIIITWSAAKISPYEQANAIVKKPLIKDDLELLLIEYGYILNE